MQFTIISIYDYRFTNVIESSSIIEGHAEEKFFYTDSWIEYKECLEKYATEELLVSYCADVIGIRVMYINVDKKIKFNSKLLGDKAIQILDELINKGAAVVLNEKRFQAFNPRKFGYYGNFLEI